MIHGQWTEGGRIYLDNTILASEAKCQTAATIRHIYERAVVDESVTLVSGQAIHKAMERYFKGGSAAEAMWEYEGFYRPYWERASKQEEVIRMLGGDEKVANDRRSFENVRLILQQWFSTHPQHAIPFQVDVTSVEEGFEVPLIPEEGVWYAGTPDIGKVTMEGGTVWAVDHKSTGRMTSEWRRGFRTSGQVSGYLWGLQQVKGCAYTGMFVNAVEVVRVPQSSRKCADHATPYSECGVLHLQSDLFPVQRTQEEIERWKKNAMGLARQYVKRLNEIQDHPERSVTEVLAEVSQHGKLTGGCAYCSHEDFCGSGQSEWLLEAKYVKKSWDPATRGERVEEGGGHEGGSV